CIKTTVFPHIGRRWSCTRARVGCKEPLASQLVQHTEVLSLPGSPRRARSPSTATDLADCVLFLVRACSSPPPSAPPLRSPSSPPLSLHRRCDYRCHATRRL